jgi:uncharacterized protein (TIGR02680 family)
MQATMSANGASPARLPSAESTRWRPVRSGLLNLYRYDNEEFWFHEGRLLLRGNNGTGKSRVLALQLPFLLDGETAPHRLEPDGDPAKRIEWNLLMGKYPDRLGYTWIEFGRRDDQGAAHYLTLGCGLHATEGRGLVGRWFFVTDQRVGEELLLESEEGYPIMRDRLANALGQRGEVFTTAMAYRNAVDTALFQLGEHRYSALVGLLIQLRQPQLSRQLDEKRLSTALGEALRPLSPSVVADVAEAFRSLESDRATLDVFGVARRGTETFLGEYRRYAQIAARRRAERVRATHAAYEATMRKLRGAEAELAQATQDEISTIARLDQLALDDRAATAVVETLRASPQMRNADALHAARQLASDRERQASLAQEAFDRAAATRRDRDSERAAAEHAARDSRSHLDRVGFDARERAVAAGVDRDHEAAVSTALAGDVLTGDQRVRAQRRFGEIVERRQRASRHVRQLNDALASARHAYESAKEAHTHLSADLDNAVDGLDRARQAHGLATAALVTAFKHWAAALVELVVGVTDDMLETLVAWSDDGDGKSPISVAVSAAAFVAANRLAEVRASVEQRRGAASRYLAELRQEHERLVAGHHVPPATPYTRDDRTRETRLGAPLWRLCDFRPEVPADVRAGVEAALEAANLLDAWVLPSGRMLEAAEHDTVLLDADDDRGMPSRHLGTVLVAAVDRTDSQAAPITDEIIDRLLAHIGLGAGSGGVWADSDGCWRVGPLHGAWAKPTAQHIGESAREAARRARIAALAIEISETEQTIVRIEDELAQIANREGVANTEAASAPDDGAVRRTISEVAAATSRVNELRDKVRISETTVSETHRAMRLRLEDRDRAASDLGVAAWVDDLQGLDDAIAEYRASVSDLLSAAERNTERARQHDAAVNRAASAAQDETRCREVLDDARRGAAQAAAERDTLNATIGAAVEEILVRLNVAETALGRVRDDRSKTDDERGSVRVRIAQAKTEAGAHEEMLVRDAAERQTAITALDLFVRTRLLAVCDPQLGDVALEGGTVTRAVDAARRIEASLSGTASDDAVWRRSEEQIYRHVQALTDVLLPHGYDPATETADGILVVTASFQGRRCTMAELRSALDEEITNRQALLNAREREILENHLVGEVAQHLHELLRDGERNVVDMNRELRDRPTSTGMTLRFAWQPADDGPEEFPNVRKHLLRAGATWSASDREALGAFLQRRIHVVRAANETGTWQEHLALALDYRAWHQFVVERQQDGQWKRLTRRTHGTGSGGEKAIALTIPQFAAAAAHYRTAHPLAPRLILLDEAFVGIDTDMRSKSMGLLHAFDLDFVMTSEREWGCYATLPGLAIYQLATRAGIDAVGVTRWVWNGHQRVRADHQGQPRPSTSEPEPPNVALIPGEDHQSSHGG